MSKLRTRIVNQAGNHAAAMGTYHPFGTPDTPVTMPAHTTTWTPAGAMFEQLHVIVASNGAPIYGAAQVNPTGRVHRAGQP